MSFLRRFIGGARRKEGGPRAAMTLAVSESPACEERVVAQDPDGAAIERAVRGLSWADITFVVLKVDERNWIEGSGSLDPTDGLSAKVVNDGEERVSRHPPRSLEEIILLLQSYRAGDGRWKEMIDWD